MEEVLAYTVVAELPRDLGAPHMGVFAFTPGEPWDGWSRDAMSQVIQYEVDAGRRPEYRIVLRTVRVRGQLPLQAADLAFGDWAVALQKRRHRLQRRLKYARYATLGLRRHVTVAAVTAFLPLTEVPREPDRPPDAGSR